MFKAVNFSDYNQNITYTHTHTHMHTSNNFDLVIYINGIHIYTHTLIQSSTQFLESLIIIDLSPLPPSLPLSLQHVNLFQ